MPYIEAKHQAPVIVTFHVPPGRWFDFNVFYQFLAARGVLIYPGKLTRAPSFRIGCIGAIGTADIRHALDIIGQFMAQARSPDMEIPLEALR